MTAGMYQGSRRYQIEAQIVACMAHHGVSLITVLSPLVATSVARVSATERRAA